MTGIITKIDPPKENSWHSGVFIRIYFKMEDGSWAQTDVVPDFRNYVYWKPIIESGLDTQVSDLVYKSKSKIDADCQPRITGKSNNYSPQTQFSL